MNSQDWTTLASRVDRRLVLDGRSAFPSARAFVAATKRTSEQSVTEYHVGQSIGMLVAAAQQHGLKALEVSASKQHVRHARNQLMYWLRSFVASLRHDSALASQRGLRQRASSQRRLAAQLEVLAEGVTVVLSVSRPRGKRGGTPKGARTQATSRRKRSG